MFRCVRSAFFIIAIVFAISTPASGEVSFDSDGLTFSPDNSEIEVNFGGRFHLDSAVSENGFFGDEFGIRRGRADVTIKFNDSWRIKIDREFSNDRAGWRNVWVEYRHGDVRLKLGQFISPLSIEDLMESNDLAFVERSLPSALSSSFRTGGSATYRQETFSLTAALMGDPIDNGSRRDDGQSVILRGVFNPVRSGAEIVHLAISGEYRDLDENAFTQIHSGHEISLRDRRFLSNPRDDDATDYRTLNLEAGYLKNGWLVQAQYLNRNTRSAVGNSNAQGGYVQVSHMFGEARRRYSRTMGAFGVVEPETSSGVVELSVRASHLNLDETSNENAKTAAVTWYVNKNLRMTGSVTHSDITESQPAVQSSGLTTQTRFQVAF